MRGFLLWKRSTRGCASTNHLGLLYRDIGSYSNLLLTSETFCLYLFVIYLLKIL